MVLLPRRLASGRSAALGPVGQIHRWLASQPSSFLSLGPRKTSTELVDGHLWNNKAETHSPDDNGGGQSIGCRVIHTCNGILKCSSERWVCAPHSLLSGTSTTPRLSVSFLMRPISP